MTEIYKTKLFYLQVSFINCFTVKSFEIMDVIEENFAKFHPPARKVLGNFLKTFSIQSYLLFLNFL